MSLATTTLSCHGRRLLATSMRVPGALDFLGPVFWIAGAIVAGACFSTGGMEALTYTIAVLIAVWAFINARAALWLSTYFMIFLFVFFQREAPLGEQLPEEFLYWGSGLAIVTAGLVSAVLFMRHIDRAAIRKRLRMPQSLAMLCLLVVLFASAGYGLIAGNRVFILERQLAGCLFLPLYYFLSLALFRSSADVHVWLHSVVLAIAFGSLWYVVKLSAASLALGSYYREQSPLTTYAGAAAIVAFSFLIAQAGKTHALAGFLIAGFELAVCVLVILCMGNRAALASLLLASALLAVIATSRRGVIATGLAAALAATVLAGAFYWGSQLLERRGLAGDIAQRFIVTVSEDRSYRGRVAQMQVILSTVRQRPLLGAGMGSETAFFAPGEEKRFRFASVDNGWGYTLLKAGWLGVVALAALLAFGFRAACGNLSRLPRGRLRASSLALLGVLIYAAIVFWGGPALFHFTSSGFFGTAFAAILVMGEAREFTSASGGAN